MIVHKADQGDTHTARCGAKLLPRLRGLDYCTTWSETVGNPVNCPDCILFHKPVRRKVATWEGLGKKART